MTSVFFYYISLEILHSIFLIWFELDDFFFPDFKTKEYNKERVCYTPISKGRCS
uniref:Uncharacterized protein n=1 Tax=Octopus bimaculoides TaxID=37653 RepID=A0A0L8HY88_OCTBM